MVFGQRVVTVVLTSAQPREQEKTTRGNSVTERQRQTESRGVGAAAPLADREFGSTWGGVGGICWGL